MKVLVVNNGSLYVKSKIIFSTDKNGIYKELKNEAKKVIFNYISNTFNAKYSVVK